MELAVLMIFGWHGKFNGAVESFEDQRLIESGAHGTAAYWRTMGVVGRWHRHMLTVVDKLAPDDGNVMRDILRIIPAMLAQDRQNRVTATVLETWFQQPLSREEKNMLWYGDEPFLPEPEIEDVL
jgi:hypothetical protein